MQAVYASVPKAMFKLWSSLAPAQPNRYPACGMRITRYLLLILVSVFACALPVSTTAVWEGRQWHATWITHPSAPLREPRVFHFRKVFRIENLPSHFVVHVSADNGFVLFVNGRHVGIGPARGDLAHWRYETFDLASFVQEGENVLAATVWQFGTLAPVAQMTDRMAFLLEGEGGSGQEVVNTNSSWRVEEEVGHHCISPDSWKPSDLYYAADPGEQIDAGRYDWSWKDLQPGATSHWVAAIPIESGSAAESRGHGFGTPWMLVADTLPAMEFRKVPAGKLVRTELAGAQLFPEQTIVVPAHTDAKLMLDRSELVTAYPELTVSGGAGSRMRLTYAEALYDWKGQKGNRNEVGDRQILGTYDEFLPDGGADRVFMPLRWRTWRYLELHVQTAEAPLHLESLRAYFTAYPFEERASFSSNDQELSRIWEIGWRTARLDSHETYMDTPYWEQLQYVGDTRIQALISYVMSGDDRLAQQALLAIDDSRDAEGITQSRYPSAVPQFIPPFSLLWVNMLHDYWMYRPDRTFVAKMVSHTRPVLEWFLTQQKADGLLGDLSWWNFVDWATTFRNGVPPTDSQGQSAILTLQFIGALRDAADLEESLGDQRLALKYRRSAQLAAHGVYRLCWDARLGLLADTRERQEYSQHANALAVWLDVVPKAQQTAVMHKLLASELSNRNSREPSVAVASYYFRFYLARALEHAGMGQLYLRLLRPWRNLLSLGFTTWPEQPEPTRSDSHAWSAHPNYDLLTTVAGIQPGAPGFARVRIAPHLGNLQYLDAAMPHPAGMIRTSYRRTGRAVEASITLPEGLQGVFLWRNFHYALRGGTQHFRLAQLPDGQN